MYNSSQLEDHAYYDLSLNNTSTTPISALLFENRTYPLIMDPSKYHLSIVRFLVPTSYLPIFIWPTVGNNLPNNNYYSVTIRRAGVDYQVFLTYVPQNNLTSVNSDYLFVYAYQQFIDAINVALKAAFIAAGGTATIPPYLIFDATTGLISIIGEYAYANLLAQYEIYMNGPLYQFFDNFNVKKFGYNQLNGKDNLIYIQNNGNNDFQSHAPTYLESTVNDSYIMTQEYNALYNWNEVRSLVFVSNSLPIANESINVQTPSNMQTSSSYRKILTDYDLNIQSGLSNNTLRSYVQYSPPGEYRLISMNTDQPIYKVDVQIFFETSNQVLYPLLINPNEYISIKMLFRSKKFKN